MNKDRAIIHLNVADFAVAVERVIDGRFRDYPVIIAPASSARGIVYDMSDEAYQEGVRKGMMLQSARKICKNARLLSPRTNLYEKAMTGLLQQVLPFSPFVEAGSDDGHLYVDISGTSRLFGPPQDVASRLRKQIWKTLGLNPVWSVASNKLIAKVATRIVKPVGEYVVAAGDETRFLAPLSIELIPGIDPVDLKRLKEFNFSVVSEVIQLSLAELSILFGPRSRLLYDRLRGIDRSPVQAVKKKYEQFIYDHGFDEDTNSVTVIEGVLYALVEKVGYKLRRKRMAARRIGVIIDYSDGIRVIRQGRINPASANDALLYAAGMQVLKKAWQRRVRIRFVRVICDRFIYPPFQLPIFPEDRKIVQRQKKLMETIDGIRGKFGKEALQFGRTFSLSDNNGYQLSVNGSQFTVVR